MGNVEAIAPRGRSLSGALLAPAEARPGKIERWQQSPKNRILFQHYCLPGALEEQVAAFVEPHAHTRAHASPSNLTPADVCFGRGEAIPAERERIKPQTLISRRSQHRAQPA